MSTPSAPMTIPAWLHKPATILALVAMILAILVPQTSAFASGEDEMNFHHANKMPTTASAWFKGEQDSEPKTCTGVPSDKDGWHFVARSNGSFSTFEATFKLEGTEFTLDIEDVAAGGQGSNHIYFATAPGAELLGATATGSGTETFNLSHVCPADGDEGTPPVDVCVSREEIYKDNSAIGWNWTKEAPGDEYSIEVWLNDVDGKPVIPCEDVTLFFSSYVMPDDWDGTGFNDSAVPQDWYDTGDKLVFEAGQQAQKQTSTVSAPDICVNAQIDLYWPKIDENGSPIDAWGGFGGEGFELGNNGHGSYYVAHRFQEAIDCPDPEPEDVELNLQKIVCPSEADVVWNADVEGPVVAAESIPDNCRAGAGWTFNLDVPGGDGSTDTAATGEDGLLSVKASEVLSEGDLDRFLDGTRLEVRENIADDGPYDFGTLRCHDDLGNEDNLEWIELDANDLPDEVWCVAYNVQEPEPEPTDVQLNFQKQVCDDYSAIPGNRLEGGADPASYYTDNADLDDTFAQGFLDWGDTTSVPIEMVDDLAGCAPASGWSFDLSFDQDFSDIEGTVGPTGGDHGTTTLTSVRDELGDEVMDRLADGDQLWVREQTQEGYLFGALQCHTDARHADNLEFIQFGGDLPESVWCVAYNLEMPDVQVDASLVCAYLPEGFSVLEVTNPSGTDLAVTATNASPSSFTVEAGGTELIKGDGLLGRVTLSWGGGDTGIAAGSTSQKLLPLPRCGGTVTPEKDWVNGDTDTYGHAGVTITRTTQSAEAGDEPGSIFVPYGGFFRASELDDGDHYNVGGLGLQRLDAGSTDLEYLANGGEYTHTVTNLKKPGTDVEVEALCLYLPDDEDGFGIASITNPNRLKPVDVTFTEGGDGTYRLWPGTHHFQVDGDVAIEWGGAGSIWRSGTAGADFDDADCTVDVTPVKEWTDEAIDLDPNLTASSGEAEASQQAGQGETLTVGFGDTYTVTEDEGDWEALPHEGDGPGGLGEDFSLTLADLGFDPDDLSEEDLVEIAGGELTYEHNVVNAPLVTVQELGPVCEDGLPVLTYEVSSTAFGDGTTVDITFTDGDDATTYEDQALSGQVLWPGAVSQADGGPQWPGWSQENGTWVPDAEHFGWATGDVEVVFTVNGDVVTSVELSFGEEFADCTGPAQIDLVKTATDETAIVFLPFDEEDPEAGGEFGVDAVYEYEITNTGAHTLYRLTLTDDRIDEVDSRVQDTLDEAMAAVGGALEPGDSVILTIDFFVEPDLFGVAEFDENEFEHTNTAVVEGFLDDDEGDDSVTATDDAVVESAEGLPLVLEREDDDEDDPRAETVSQEDEEEPAEVLGVSLELPRTGASSLVLLLVGLMAIALGAAAVRFRRRQDGSAS